MAKFLKCEGGIYINADKVELMHVVEYEGDLFYIDIYTHNHPDDEDCDLYSDNVPVKGTYYRWHESFRTYEEAEHVLDTIVKNLEESPVHVISYN